MTLQFRRGNSTEVNSVVPAPGEPLWNTQAQTLSVGDGATLGGIPISGGGNNPFDQALYTTSSVTFATIAANTATLSKLYIYNDIESTNKDIWITTQDGYGINFNTQPVFQYGAIISGSGLNVNNIFTDGSGYIQLNNTATVTQGIQFSDLTIQTTAYTGGGSNPFDQDLYTTSSVQFQNLTIGDAGVIYTSHGSYGPPDNSFTNVRIGLYGNNPVYAIGIETNYSWIQGQNGVKLYNASGVALTADATVITASLPLQVNQINTVDSGFVTFNNTASFTQGIQFSDSTVQTTAYTGGGGNPFDQTLDTTSTVTFNSINVTTSIDGVEGCVTNMTQFRSGWYAGGGYTFKSDTGYDSGMYSQGDGLINFMANNTNIIELTTSGAQFDQQIVLNGVNIVGGNYQANTLSLPVGGGATVTAGFEGGVTLRASNNNTDFSSWNFAQNGTITYNSYGNNLRLENTTGYGTTIDDISHVDVQVSVAPVNDGDPVYGAARISPGQAYLQADTTTTSLILRLSSNGQVDTGAYDIVFNENNTFSSWNTNLRNQYGSINLQTNNPDLVGGRVFTTLNHYSNNNNSSFEIYIEAADGSGNKQWYFTQAGELQFPDNTVQTTAGGTSLYARNSLPAGAQGRIITITDSGSDTNSPAGNWAPAYWDADAEAWTYVGNSNTVTII